MKRAIVLGLAFSPALAATVVFERVEPTEVRTGVMRVRTVEAPLLEVPGIEGPDAWSEARFARLYAIEFLLETRQHARTELEGRGELLVAVRTGSEELLALDGRLRSLLSSLAPDAFMAPYAGIRAGSPAFLGLAEVSTEPSWVCSLQAGSAGTTAYHRKVEEGAGNLPKSVATGSSSSGEPEQTRRLCEGFRAAVQGTAFEEIRTAPGPRELREVRVEVEEADTLPRELRQEDLPSLPDGVQATRTRAPGVRSASAWAPDHSMASYTDDEVEWKAQTAPAAVSPDVLAQGAHLTRWTVRERERRLGVLPREEARTVAVRTVAFVPVAPALLAGDRLPAILLVRLNAELLREDVAHELDQASTVDASVLEAALRGGRTHGPQWLRSEGWLLVVCRDDGTAWFGIPPTPARNTVTNAPLICAAMDRMLP